jgi:hypothetical protein
VSRSDALWPAVHEALDARRDPLDDPRVVAALEAAPERLAEVAALRAGLRALPADSKGPRRHALPLAPLAAAALLIAAGFWPRAQAPAPAASPAPPVGVLLASASVSRSSPTVRGGAVLDHHQTITVHRP